MKALGQKHGLLLNFAKPTLEIRRVIFEDSKEVRKSGYGEQR